MDWGMFFTDMPHFSAKNSKKDTSKNNLYTNDHCLIFIIS